MSGSIQGPSATVKGVVQRLLSLSAIESLDEYAPLRRRLASRKAAKDNRDFALADEIRKQLEAVGLRIVDTKDGIEVELLSKFDQSKLKALL